MSSGRPGINAGGCCSGRLLRRFGESAMEVDMVLKGQRRKKKMKYIYVDILLCRNSAKKIRISEVE